MFTDRISPLAYRTGCALYEGDDALAEPPSSSGVHEQELNELEDMLILELESEHEDEHAPLDALELKLELDT